MRFTLIMLLAAIPVSNSLAQHGVFPIPKEPVQAAFANKTGTLVIVDCSSGATSIFRPEAASEKLPPCSTFKIWNTLIGLENGVVSSPEESFYKWDGETRFIPEWNKDLTLKEAFRVSCVPAFQGLARKNGPATMRLWIDRIGYGDRNISSGVDVFWLPAPGRKTLLITPEEQALLMRDLALGTIPFSKQSQAVLKEIMAIHKTKQGVLYGKTGTGVCADGKTAVGWFVGYVEGGGRQFAFACAAKGGDVTGRIARGIVEAILTKQGIL